MPDTGSTVPAATLPLLHEPPAVISESAAVLLEHICEAPVIADIAGSTLTTAVALQPLPIKYVTVAVPGDTAVIMPAAGSIVATAPLLLLQLPPEAASLRVAVCP
jgi:hypothetical protein